MKAPQASAPARGYLDYARDAAHMALYRDYQRRYAGAPRESDRVLLELVGEALESLPAGRRPGRLLDVGCSTGNLLGHLRRAFPALELAGGDLAAGAIAEARADPDLAGVRFEVMDMLELEPTADFDVLVANASLMFFSEPEFARALARLAGALRPGGTLLAFDLFHPFAQSLIVRETSPLHPAGLELHLRPYAAVRSALAAAGLAAAELMPFSIPIDLERSSELELATYTRRTAGGERLCFRGALYQPWCHLRARRPEGGGTP